MASAAASLAKKFGTMSGRVRRSDAATKALWLYSYIASAVLRHVAYIDTALDS